MSPDGRSDDLAFAHDNQFPVRPLCQRTGTAEQADLVKFGCIGSAQLNPMSLHLALVCLSSSTKWTGMDDDDDVCTLNSIFISR